MVGNGKFKATLLVIRQLAKPPQKGLPPSQGKERRSRCLPSHRGSAGQAATAAPA